MTILFLDTEWADAAGAELVSLALVSEDGQQQFYVERDPLPASATEFVRHTVYPILDRGDAAMSDVAMTTALRVFLANVPEPYILADYPNDLKLVARVLAGFDMRDSEAQACGQIPRPVMTHMLKDGIIQMVLEDWFEAHPDEQRRRHHALVDASALRMAWLALTGRVDASWSPTLMRQRLAP